MVRIEIPERKRTNIGAILIQLALRRDERNQRNNDYKCEATEIWYKHMTHTDMKAIKIMISR